MSVEYAGKVASPVLSGDAHLSIGEFGLSVQSSFDAVDVPFVAINAIVLDGFTVRLMTDAGSYVFSALGNWCQPFYDALCDAYAQAVLRGMFMSGSPVFTASGDYRVIEGDANLVGQSPIWVYDDCVVTLPPNLTARRVPLCFATAFDQGAYDATLHIGASQMYSYAKLGAGTAGFADAVNGRLRALREKTVALVTSIAPALSPVQASQIARLLPAGAAAPMGQLAGIAPAFITAIEALLATGPAAATYLAFKQLSGPQRIWVGLRQVPDADCLVWLIAPSPDGRHAAVEFAVADTATFVYGTGGAFDGFAAQLNRALEAIAFKREVIWASADDLLKPENADWRMAIKRNSALQFVRANFAGRVIHSGEEAWRSRLEQLWGA